jgi:hypothetical protein
MFEMSRPRYSTAYGTTQAGGGKSSDEASICIVYAICIFSALLNAIFVAHVYLCLRDLINSLQWSSTVPSRWHAALHNMF